MNQNTASPRVLVVTKKMVMGGAERHLTQVLPALKARGFDVELFVLERGGELETELSRDGIAISGLVPRGGRLMHVIAAAITLYRRIWDTRPDVLHFFLPEPYLIGGVVSIIARHRICIMSRRSLAHYQHNHPWLGQAERILHRRMSALLGNSQAVVDELVVEAGDLHKIGLIHNGIDVPPLAGEDVRQTGRAALGISPDAFVMVIVANLFHYKGHADLLNALGAVTQRMPQSWRLVAIGRDEGEGQALREQADRLGIAGRILWLGERSDVDDLLTVADMGLLVSHQEGFSNALIEMMGQGLPVVATAVGGNMDAIADGQSGRLVPPHDPVTLGAALVELANDPERRNRMGLAARQRVLTLFSQSACIDRYERLYRGIGKANEQSIQSLIDGGT